MGYRGTSLDSLWVQNLFNAFVNDDDELAEIALKSKLADLTEVVEGGEYGCPFSIAEHGFYANNQFEQQATLLKSAERSNASSNFFLSDAEWEKVDTYLDQTSRISKAEFESVQRGDSFGVLAIKKNAFRVAICLLKHGLDPVIENELGEDLFNALQKQYHHLTLKWKAMASNVLELQKRAALKSEVDAAEKEEQKILHALDEIVVFANELKANLEARLVSIANDTTIQRRCQLLNQPFDPQKLWNIQRKERVLSDLQGIEELNLFVKERITFSRQQQSTRRKLRLQSTSSTIAAANAIAQSRGNTATSEKGLTGFFPLISSSDNNSIGENSVSSTSSSSSKKRHNNERVNLLSPPINPSDDGSVEQDQEDISLKSLLYLPPIKETDIETNSHASHSTMSTARRKLRRGASTGSAVSDGSSEFHEEKAVSEENTNLDNLLADSTRSRLILRDESEVHIQYK